MPGEYDASFLFHDVGDGKTRGSASVICNGFA